MSALPGALSGDFMARATKTTAGKVPAAKAAETTTKQRKSAAGKAPAKPTAQKASSASPPARSSSDVRKLFARFAAKEPEPKGELEHVNAFTLLVAVVLSAQATDAGVNKATRALFVKADTPQKMLALGEDAVREHIKTIGLFRNKAKNVILLSELLIRDHRGVVPADRDALVALPGVGRKTANVVLSMAFGQKTMAVDTHVFRIAHRLGLSYGTTPEAVEDDLMRLVPDDYLYHAHHWLILHGRYTCLARGPKCSVCAVADLCTSSDKTIAS
jgi:endonuclease III